MVSWCKVGLAAWLGMIFLQCSGSERKRSVCGTDSDCASGKLCMQGTCVAGTPAPPHGDALMPREAVPRSLVPLWQWKFDASHHGRSTYSAPLAPPHEVWQWKTKGAIVGSPALSPSGEVFVGSHDGTFYALSAEGSLRWKFVAGGKIWTPPALTADGLVLFGADDDWLYALYQSSGTLKWKLRIGDCGEKAIGPESLRCDVDSGPTIGSDGTIYVGGDGLYAISIEGEIRWKMTTSEHVLAAPAVAKDGTVYAATQGGVLYAFTAAGQKKWEWRAGDAIESSPAIGDDGTVYLGSDDHNVYAISPEGVLKWKVSTQGDVRASPSIGRDGTVYVGSYDRGMYAISPAGAIIWRYAAADKIHGPVTLAQNGIILFGGLDEHVYALDQHGNLLWFLDANNDVDSLITLTSSNFVITGGDDGILRAYSP